MHEPFFHRTTKVKNKTTIRFKYNDSVQMNLNNSVRIQLGPMHLMSERRPLWVQVLFSADAHHEYCSLSWALSQERSTYWLLRSSHQIAEQLQILAFVMENGLRNQFLVLNMAPWLHWLRLGHKAFICANLSLRTAMTKHTYDDVVQQHQTTTQINHFLSFRCIIY